MQRFRTLVTAGAVIAILLAAMVVSAQITKTIPAYGEVFFSRLSSDGRLLATFEDGNYHADEVNPLLLPIRVYDVERGVPVQTLIGQQDYARDVAFSPDNRLLAAYYGTGWLYVWEVESGALVRQIPVAPNSGQMQWLPGTSLVAITAGAQIQLWDTEAGHMTSLLMERMDTMAELREALSGGMPDAVAAMRGSPDGTRIATATLYGRLLIWDVASGERAVIYDAELEQPRLPMLALYYSADGERLYTLDRETGSLLVFDAATGAILTQITADGSQRPLAVSPDGERAAWLNGGGTTLESIQVADVESGEITEIPSPLPDGKRVFIPLAGLYFDAGGDRLIMTGAAADMESDIPYENAIYLVPLPD